jgi:chromosome segregation ATPase
MSTFFWILGLLATAGLTFLVMQFIIGDKLCTQLTRERKRLEDDCEVFKKSYADAQQWYSKAWRDAEEKTKALRAQEKELHELKAQLEAQIIKNNQEKEECLRNFSHHLNRNKTYLARLETQLASARQRAKRFEKQAKNKV